MHADVCVAVNLPAGEVAEGKKRRKADIAARDRKIKKAKTNAKPKKEKTDEDHAALQAFQAGASKEKGEFVLL
jgi:hypothetical protein